MLTLGQRGFVLAKGEGREGGDVEVEEVIKFVHCLRPV